jgi:hypothetical protein
MKNHIGDNVVYLGKDKDGYKYYLSTDNYVYQQFPDGRWNGWVCFITSWENAFTGILV